MAVAELQPRAPHFADSVLELPLARLVPAEDNPRRDVGDVTELATSIKSVGLLEPILATPRDLAAGTYTVVAGHRRLAAAELAGLAYVPVYVKELSDQERLAAMLVENLQRTDLQPLEEAGAYRRLVDEFGMTQRDLAEKVGRSQGHVAKRLSLLKLPAAVQADVDSGGITLADASALARLGDDPDAIARVRKISAWFTAEHGVERELERRGRQKKVAAALAAAESEGLRVVAMTQTDDYGHRYQLPKGTYRIAKSPQYGSDVLGLDPKKHETLDCHAVTIDPRGLDRIPVCTNRKNHPKAKTPDERWREQNSLARAASTGSRPTGPDPLDVAEEARLRFVRELFQRKGAVAKPAMLDAILRSVLDLGALDESGDFALIALGLAEIPDGGRSNGPLTNADGDPIVAVDEMLREYASRGDRELLLAAFAVALGQAETNGCTRWSMTWNDDAATYVRLLEQHGYEVTPAERKKLPKTKAAS